MTQLSILDRAGVVIPTDVSNQGIIPSLEYAGLNWNVEQLPVHSDYGPISNMVANYRSDDHTFLGMVSASKYKVVQNSEAFSFIDELDNFTIEKVGAFDNGKKVYIVGKDNSSFDIDTGDRVDMYLTFVHGHDGLTAIRIFHCPIRMFCMNQMNMMTKKSNFKFSTKHTGNVEAKLAEVHAILDKGHVYMEAVQQEVRLMLDKPFTVDIDTFLNQLFPIDDDASTTQKVFNNGVKQTIRCTYLSCDNLQNFKGTAFGMYSAVSDFVSHYEPQRRSRNVSEASSALLIKNLEGNDVLERCHQMLLEAA